MKKLLDVLFVFGMVFCLASAAAAADPDNMITIKTDSPVILTAMTLEGSVTGPDPETGIIYDEINGAEITSADGYTIASLPADQTYVLWANEAGGENSVPFDAYIETDTWSFQLLGLYGSGAQYDLVITPLQEYAEDSFLFEKVQVTALPGRFPDAAVSMKDDDGICSFGIKPSFSPDDSHKAADTMAKLVFTAYPEMGAISVWAAAQDWETAEYFYGSEFMLAVSISCETGSGTVSAKTPKDSPVRMNENGIFFINYAEFKNSSDAFFEGDLDGDDDYEVSDPGSYFVITDSIL